MISAVTCPYFRRAFGWCVPIGGLGGLIGLGGGDLLPAIPSAHFAAGAGIGIGVGLVSSTLGVAGGELLIPALILIFSWDIKTAGSVNRLQLIGVVSIC